MARWWCPMCTALGQHTLHLVCRELLALYTNDGQTVLRHIDLNQVILLDQGDGTTLQGLRCDMAYVFFISIRAKLGSFATGIARSSLAFAALPLPRQG